MIKKLPSELSEDELLKQLESSEEEIIPEAPNNVVEFLLYFKIEPGAFPVKKQLLFRLYKQHTKEMLAQRQFYIEVTNYIPATYDSFLINKHSFSISHKTFELLKRHQTKQRSPVYRRHFENFIKAYDLKDGDIHIPSTKIYNEYKEWCKTVHRDRPIGLKNFHKFLKSYFRKIKTNKTNMYVYINREISEKETKEKQLAKSNKKLSS